MQNNRLAMASIHLIGIFATVALFWAYVDFNVILLWAAVFLILLLLRSLHVSNALVERRFQTTIIRPWGWPVSRVYAGCIIGRWAAPGESVL